MLEFLQYAFMQRALIAGFFIAVLAPTIGLFLVVKRYSLLADTLSHVSLVGAALSALLGVPALLATVLTSSLAAFGIEELRVRRQLFGESLLALVLSGSLALAIVLFSFVQQSSIGLISLLFGSITTVTSSELWAMGLVSLMVLVGVLGTFKTLFLVSYDEELARANGVPVRGINLLLVLLAAITVSVSVRLVGTLLVGALMVIPVLTATQFKQSFRRTYGIALGCSLVAVFTGLVGSYYADIPSGGAIVLVALVLFGMSLSRTWIQKVLST